MKKIITCFVFLLAVLKANAQAPNDFDKIGYLLSDALLYSEQYIIPITDAAVYQSSSGWVLSPKKKKLWDISIGLHTNIFFVPKKDRKFTINNTDFQFFEIEGNTTATVPSALGDDNQVYLVGEIGGEQVRFKTPEGVNQETIVYPYLQASLELPLGFEFTGRYATKTKLKKGYYQVFGGGLKYNISQHFSRLENKKINVAVATIFTKEDIGFDFLDIDTPYGNLGINQINGKVDTWHFNLVASKEFKNFELIGNFIVNNSKFEYLVSGPKGTIEGFIPVQDIINDLLTRIEKDKVNYICEISGIYHINRLALQSSFAFGKFANLNIGVQYKF